MFSHASGELGIQAWRTDSEKDSGKGAWRKVPTWNGSPLTWRSFKREMAWWASCHNLVARWFLRQTGTVQQRGLEYQKRDTRSSRSRKPARNWFSFPRIRWQGSTCSWRLRTQFYLHLARKPVEWVADYASPADFGRRSQEGVHEAAGPRLGLHALRMQLPESGLRGSDLYVAFGSSQAARLRVSGSRRATKIRGLARPFAVTGPARLRQRNSSTIAWKMA